MYGRRVKRSDRSKVRVLNDWMIGRLACWRIGRLEGVRGLEGW